MRLAVPAKCGTTRWFQLLMIAQTGRMPRPVYEYSPQGWLRSHAFAPERLWACARSLPRLARRTVWLVVVRNPYERLLSGWLDKLAREPRHPSFHVRLPPALARPNATASEYAAFVEWYGKRPGWIHRRYAADMSLYAQLHLWPIVHTWVEVRDALWSQSDEAYASVYGRARLLQVEHMSRWYAPLVRELGLQAAAGNRREWASGCFFRASSESCDAALDPTAAHPPRACDDGVEQPPWKRGGYLHNTSACAKLWAFYTPRTAEVVTALFRQDLDALGYPVWSAQPGSVPW